MKFQTIAAAVIGGAVLMSGGPTAAQAVAQPAAQSPAEPSAQTTPDDPIEAAMTVLEADPIAGLAAFEQLAAAGEVEAMNMVAIIVSDPPPGIPADPERAMRLWEQALAGGSKGARLNLGTRLLLNDTKDDDARAVEMLRGVEPEFMAYAAYPLGRAYLFGDGVEQDLERGSRLMEMAVLQSPGNIDAQFLLARAYQNGWGIPEDPGAAYEHMKIAADGEDPRAQWNVGMMLLDGVGVTANPGLARQYVQRSAEAGYGEGMTSMAVMLALGQGGAVDAPASRVWYERAARQGSAHALRGLGMMLIVGEGGAADPATGSAYLQLAAEGGDEPARVLQQRLAAQIAAADPAKVRLARQQWLAAVGAVH